MDRLDRNVAGCEFCSIVADRLPAVVVRRWPDVLAIEPRNPVVAGHVLVIPHAHVADVGVDPLVSARTMECAAELAAGLPAVNVITSKGAAATQSIFHLHLHVVPRHARDAVPLPWTPPVSTRRVADEKGR